jgi:DNA-binding MarR family transcriptional regulator
MNNQRKKKMSNAYATQALRFKNRIGWQDEYIIGMVGKEAPLTTTGVFKIAEAENVMSQATTHKYLKRVVAKKFVQEKSVKVDKRANELTLTEKGRNFLEEIKHAYVGK